MSLSIPAPLILEDAEHEQMLKKERYKAFIDYFSNHQPNAETELVYTNPYELLVAVILSAQCTDKRVNMTTPALFERFTTSRHLAAKIGRASGRERVCQYV